MSKKIEYQPILDLAPYMSCSHTRHAPKQPAGLHLYDLYAVLVHHGHSVHSGHYVCYVKAPNGMWHLCDDSRVAQVSERQVLGQQAYILFYIRRHPRTHVPVQNKIAADGQGSSHQQQQQQQNMESNPPAEASSKGDRPASKKHRSEAAAAAAAGPQLAGSKRKAPEAVAIPSPVPRALSRAAGQGRARQDDSPGDNGASTSSSDSSAAEDSPG